MYRHLMVPVDDSILSAANVDAAVRLAGRLEARITFFYAATEPRLATGGDSVLSTLSPGDEPADTAQGEANALLSKARAGALAAGVPCDAVARFCESPATVIVDTALARGCDIIVMASRGRRGVAGCTVRRPSGCCGNARWPCWSRAWRPTTRSRPASGPRR